VSTDPINRANQFEEKEIVVDEAEEYVLGVALQQTLTSGVFSPYLHNFHNTNIATKDWKLILKSLEKKDLLAHYGLTLTGIRYVQRYQLADNTQLALMEHYKREVLRSLLSHEAGRAIAKGMPISNLVEIVPVSYALLMICLGSLEIDNLLVIDRRRIITAGPMLREKMASR
jgi:hypothetical protein